MHSVADYGGWSERMRKLQLGNFDAETTDGSRGRGIPSLRGKDQVEEDWAVLDISISLLQINKIT